MLRTGRLFAVPLSSLGLILAAISPHDGFASPVNHLLDNSSGSNKVHSNPVIRSYADKVVALWNDLQTPGSATEPRIHYAVSTDSGATFTDLGAPPAPNGTGRWRGDPQLAVDPANGTFFMVGHATTPTAGIWACRGLFSGSVLNWSTPVLVRTTTSGSYYPGHIALDNSLTGNVLHLLVETGTGAIEYQRSTDGNGFVWSAPVRLSSPADSAAGAGYPRLASGPVGATYAAWVGPLGLNTQPIRVRKSMDHGQSWGPEQTITTHMNPVLLGAAQMAVTIVNRPPFSMAVNRTAGSTTFGQVALAWSESWDFSDEPFPSVASTFIRSEVEPNDVLDTETPFNVGETLQGALSSSTDIDYWPVHLMAGDPLLVWADTLSNARILIVTPDELSEVAGVGGGSYAAFAFRAPFEANFAIKVMPNNGGFGSYRIRTRVGTPGVNEARDAGDVAVAYSNGGAWTVRRFAFAPPGYDDYLPTIGYGADGLDYVSWYDPSRHSSTGSASLVVARNLTGLDPVPSPPVQVSDLFNDSDFNTPVGIAPPGVGCANDIYSDGRRVFLAWTDLRFQTVNVYAASLANDALPIAFPVDTTVTAGATATLHARVLNRNPEFSENVVMRLTGSRSWPSGVVRDSVPPGATGIVSIPIAIPDTATAGPYVINVQYERQSGIVLANDPVILLIQSVSGVGDRPPVARLEPIAPNPTRGPARIAFSLARAGEARVEVFGIRGERVRTLWRGAMTAGEQSLRWDGRDDAGHLVPAGLYFVTLENGSFRAVKPMVVLK